MAPQDYAGRIPRESFIISTSVLLAVLLLGVAVRFAIRFRLQKQQFAVDDGFLLLALSCLIASIIIMYREVLDRMYLIVALQAGMTGVTAPPGWMDISFEFHKWVTVCLMLSWSTAMAVKFSFLFFFRRLIDQLQPLRVYWWIVTVYTVGCLGYGISVYYIGCPYYFDPRELRCASGIYKQPLVSHSIAQMTLDLVGDLMILAIPIAVIWKVRVQWLQKIAIMFSLCLTVFMMAVTIARVSGLVYHGNIDTIWEVYWTLLGGEVGVFMAAATAFRSFFVARKNSRRFAPPHQSLKRFFTTSFANKFNPGKVNGLDDSLLEETSPGLPEIPRAQMTGMRTFIDAKGRTPVTQTEFRSEPKAKERTLLQEHNMG